MIPERIIFVSRGITVSLCPTLVLRFFFFKIKTPLHVSKINTPLHVSKIKTPLHVSNIKTPLHVSKVKSGVLSRRYLRHASCSTGWLFYDADLPPRFGTVELKSLAIRVKEENDESTVVQFHLTAWQVAERSDVDTKTWTRFINFRRLG